MKEIVATQKKYWEKYDMDVFPYIPIEWCRKIADVLVEYDNPIDREQALVSDVLLCTTPLFDEENADKTYTYEQLVYSGFWDEFLEEFPYIKQGIDLILKEVANRESLVNTITEGLTGLMQGLTDGIEKAQEEGVDNNLLKLMDMFKTWKDTQETSEE